MQTLWLTVSRAAILAVLLSGAAAVTLDRSWAQTEPSGEKRPSQPATEKAAPGPPNALPAGTGFNDGRKPSESGDVNASAQPPVAGPPLANGVLTSGTASDRDVDTAPAKFSAQNAADDQLPVVAYTFRDLTPEQRRAVFEAVTGGDAAVSADASSVVAPTLGSEIPSGIAGRQLKPMPAALTTQMPRFAQLRYMRSGDLVLAVAPNNNMVVGVFNKDGSISPAAIAMTAATDPKGANDAPPATAAPGSH